MRKNLVSIMSEKFIAEKINDIIAKWDKRIEGTDKNLVFENLTFSSGLPGVILLLLENDREKNRQKAEEYIDYMVGIMSEKGILTDSLYSGAAGIGLSILPLVGNDNKYRLLQNSINEYIDYSVGQRVINFEKNNVTPLDYDVIEGISGVLVYLLSIDDSNLDYLITKIVNFLLEVMEDDREYIPFYVKSENQLSKEESKIYPRGCLNMGVAHGIAGIGIVLAYSIRKGYGGRRARIVLRKIISLYEKFELTDNLGKMWKDGIEEAEYKKQKILFPPKHLRDAWCYGSPGISLLYLYAGIVENSKYLKDKAKFILLEAVQRRLGVDTWMLCHGEQGLIEICSLFKKLLKVDLFDKYIKGYSSNSLSLKNEPPTFLEGSVGIILSILHLEYGKNNTDWRHALLLFEDFES